MKTSFAQLIDASSLLFFQLNSRIDGRTNISDDIHEEKPSFLQFKKTHYRRTDGRMDQRTVRPY